MFTPFNVACDSRRFEKAFATNSTASAFTARIPTITEPPNGNGVIDLRDRGDSTHTSILVVLFGAGADNDTLDHRLIGWDRIGDVWVPVPIINISATLSATVGIAGEDVIETDRFADALVASSPYPSSAEVFSPGGDRVAWYTIDPLGFAKLQFDFDRTGTTTSCNALVKRL